MLELVVRNVPSAATPETSPVADISNADDTTILEREGEDLTTAEASPAAKASDAYNNIMSEREKEDFATADMSLAAGIRNADDAAMSEKAGEDNTTTETNPTATASDVHNSIVFDREGEGYRPSVDCPDYSEDEPLATQQALPIHAKTAHKDITGDAEKEDGNKDNDDRDGYRPEGEQEDAPMDTGDDSDVQFLFERCSTLTGSDEAEPGSDEDGPGGEAGDNDAIPNEVNPLRDLRAVLHVADDLEVWERTCRLFCHDKARTAYDQGVKLLGTTLCLRPHQMEAVYALLQRSFGGHFSGGIVALDTGLRKTIVSLAAVAVMRLVELNYHEVRQEWSTATQNAGVTTHRRHNPHGVTGPCPSGNPWSIECCCVAGSFSSGTRSVARFHAV